MEFYQEIERGLTGCWRKPIWRPFMAAIREYALVAQGDRIAVCISGGKDSMLLAKCMQELRRHSPLDFELRFLAMDPGYAPENRRRIEKNAELQLEKRQMTMGDIMPYPSMTVLPSSDSLTPFCGCAAAEIRLMIEPKSNFVVSFTVIRFLTPSKQERSPNISSNSCTPVFIYLTVSVTAPLFTVRMWS